MPDIFQQVGHACKNGDLETAEKLLLRRIRYEERRVRNGKDTRVGSWGYERLAIIYRKRGDHSKEIELLLQYVDDEEQRVRAGQQFGVGAWAYDRLARIYRKSKEYDKEVEILKRFISQPKYIGRAQETLPGRLAKAEELASLGSASLALRPHSIVKKNESPRFVAFDIEIAKILPNNVDDLKSFRPLGICCAAVLEALDDHPHLWHSCGPDGKFAEQMDKCDLEELVRFLSRLVDNGATIVTWNGLGFDFDILAEESGRYDECKTLALNHVDLMFHILCEQGYPVSLSSACQALAVGSKPSHFNPASVPRLWKELRCEEVLSYVANDCRLILEVFHACTKRRCFEWITQKGTRSSFSLPHGWLKVCYAVNIPLPDTSWMRRPLPRSKFLSWTAGE